MKISKTRLALKSLVSLTIALAAASAQPASAADVPHLTRVQPGGMPGLPLITGITRSSNQVTLTWDGPAGAYRLLQKLSVTDPVWQPVGGVPHLLSSATVTAPSSAALFIVSGPSPKYAGSQSCQECHNPKVQTAIHTSHYGAFNNPAFVALGGQTDVSCLPCHSVGNGLPTGFSGFRTPNLANVQCESCHGPAGWHAANPEDPVSRPRVDIASPVCGGCHNSQFVPARVAALHPSTYEDWAASGHRAVRDELKADFSSSAGTTLYMPSCGGCHSGTVREALIDNTPLPSGHEAGAIGIACATCHDAHQLHTHTNVLHGLHTNLVTGFVINNSQLGSVYTNQLRYPLASLADHHSTGAFATNYNPRINVCAQCHNDRGASASTSSRPPHHSSQYNMLLGSFRQSDTTVPSNQTAAHAFLEKQCASCHMQTEGGSSGHSFKVQTFGACISCHEQPELLVQFTTNAVTRQIQQGKAALDFWALNAAPAALQKYGARAWEYSNPGGLSGPGPAPSAAEQPLIPEAIRKARFNLYLVFNEGSFGVHNGPYAIELLSAAYNLVLDELEN